MMNDSKINSIEQIKNFLSEAEPLEFNNNSRKEAYCWIEGTLQRFNYLVLSKVEKGLVRRYLRKVTGYSKSQLTRQIHKYCKTGQIRIKEYERNKFKKKYITGDIQLLAKTAQLHDNPNGAALKKILERMVREYGKEEYQNIAHISVSHIYNLKKKVSYLRSASFYQKTNKGKAKALAKGVNPNLKEDPATSGWIPSIRETRKNRKECIILIPWMKLPNGK